MIHREIKASAHDNTARKRGIQESNSDSLAGESPLLTIIYSLLFHLMIFVHFKWKIRT